MATGLIRSGDHDPVDQPDKGANASTVMTATGWLQPSIRSLATTVPLRTRRGQVSLPRRADRHADGDDCCRRSPRQSPGNWPSSGNTAEVVHDGDRDEDDQGSTRASGQSYSTPCRGAWPTGGRPDGADCLRRQVTILVCMGSPYPDLTSYRSAHPFRRRAALGCVPVHDQDALRRPRFPAVLMK